MERPYGGKVYLNGVCLQYSIPPRLTADQRAAILEKKERARLANLEAGLPARSFQIGFKQRMKIYDAITFQHLQAQSDTKLYHCFLTATFDAYSVPPNPNAVFSDFVDKLKKAGFYNYVWTRELTKLGTPHYHFTTVGPSRPINSKKGWSINKAWSDSRGYYSGNGIRSSINPVTKRSQMVIHSIVHARQYVAKYIAKANNDQSGVPGRIYAISNDLAQIKPESYKHAIELACHPYYGDKRDLVRRDFCTIGGIRPDLAPEVFAELQKENEIERKRLEKRMVESRLIPSYSKSDQLDIGF